MGKIGGLNSNAALPASEGRRPAPSFPFAPGFNFFQPLCHKWKRPKKLSGMGVLFKVFPLQKALLSPPPKIKIFGNSILYGWQAVPGRRGLLHPLAGKAPNLEKQQDVAVIWADEKKDEELAQMGKKAKNKNFCS